MHVCKWMDIFIGYLEFFKVYRSLAHSLEERGGPGQETAKILYHK